MIRISSIIWSLILMEMGVLFVCLLATIFLLRATFLRKLNIRQELRAKEYLFTINRNVFFQIRGIADLSAIFFLLTTTASKSTSDPLPPPEKHCSEFSIDDCQRYTMYTLVGLSSLAVLDCLIVIGAVGRLTKADIVSVLLSSCVPLSYFAGLYAISSSSPLKDEAVATICYGQNQSSTTTSYQQAAGNLLFQRINSIVFFTSICVVPHSAYSHLTKLAAEMFISIVEDSKTGTVRDKSYALDDPSDAILIQTELDKESTTTMTGPLSADDELDNESTTMTGPLSDDENIRMWRRYFLVSGSNAKMCAPSHWQSLCRFSYVQARLYLSLVVNFACIIGLYYYAENYFFQNSELKYFTLLIFATMLTINGVVRVAVAATNEALKEEAKYRKIYDKDIFEYFRRMYHRLLR